ITYYAAWALDEGVAEGPLAASMAKAYVSDAYRRVAAAGIQLHGGIGFTWEHDLHLYFKRAKGSEFTFGDATYHRERVAQLVNLSQAADAEPARAQRRLTVMRDVAVEASVTVRRLQEFVSRQPQVAFGPVGLPAVIAEAVEMTAPRWRDDAQRRGIVVTVTKDLEPLPPVEGNGFELRDAILRLILNALSAMPEGGSLTIRAASEESGWVVVEVRDTGVGMAEEVRRRVVERA